MKPSNIGQRMLRLAISDTAVLRACFMPFLRHKGLFVPSLQSRELGEKLFLVLRLQPQNSIVAGLVSVCWITPGFSGDGREAGYGLHFDEAAGELRTAVETALGPDNADVPQSVSYTL